MDKTIDYYFATISPWAYLGHERFVGMARRYGATIAVKPVDFSRVFAASGGLPLKQRSAQRQAYRIFELKRWSALLRVPLVIEPKHFPVNGDPAAKWILAANEAGSDAALAFSGAVGRAIWVEERDVADPATLAAIATGLGQDPVALAQRAAAPDIGARYDALTAEAIERGVFGAPYYIYRGEPFWGQDRLDFLDLALAK